MQSFPTFINTKKINQISPYIIENSFSDEEIEWVNNLSKLYTVEKGIVGGEQIPIEENTPEGVKIENLRSSDIHWIHPDDNSSWLYDKLKTLIEIANDDIFHFGLHSIMDHIQYTKYYDNGDHYNWHVDLGPDTYAHRKLSITIQLSDPSEYDGGDFQIMTSEIVQTLPKEKGLAIVFPSYLLHRVTPVTRGVRKSLVLWVGGSQFI